MAKQSKYFWAVPLLKQASIFTATAGALFFLTGAAAASPNFPDAVQEVAGSDCAPSCLLCHKSNPGRKGTGTQPFGIALIGKGIVGGEDDAAVTAALIKMRDGEPAAVPPVPMTDVDTDGMTDFDELAAGINPNPGDGELCEVTYGCGARLAPTAPTSGWAIFSSALLALGLVLLSSKARRNAR